MSRATVELDFFGLENNQSDKSFRRQRSFRDLHSAISKINPELLKSVISSGAKDVPQNALPTAFNSPTPRSNIENRTAKSTLTIFYNGKIVVADVEKDKAETILKLAEKGVSKAPESSSASKDHEQQQLFDSLDGDLPIARKKSLQRFLQKRKERLTCATPYDL